MAKRNTDKMTISSATKRNWQKLAPNLGDKLKSRANKSRSQKTFIPLERIQNKDSVPFIESLFALRERFSIAQIMHALCLNAIDKSRAKEPLARRFLDEYPRVSDLTIVLPDNFDKESDLLGTIYQSLLSEGDKNIRGSYYTTQKTARLMLQELDISSGEKFLDPCCGSGIFLLEAARLGCSVVGNDIDPIAVMIAKANLIAQNPEALHYPDVRLLNFLNPEERKQIEDIGPFDASASNPPWGGEARTVFNETASEFFFAAFDLLKKGGKQNFLLPSSLLNVAKHRRFRESALKEGRILQIRVFSERFTGVQTNFVSFLYQKSAPAEPVRFVRSDGKTTGIPLHSFELTAHKTFLPVSREALELLNQVKKKGTLSLVNSRWGLGIVTGNNQTCLKTEQTDELEPIYTGKEIQPYRLSAPKRFIRFTPQNFQQCAPEALFRTSPKLLYKFIGSKLVFAIDNERSLALNSANILIPDVEGLSIYSVMGLLNSPLFNALHRMLFKEIKILKGNLCQLPLPRLSPEEDTALTEAVKAAIENPDREDTVNRLIEDLYELTPQQRLLIQSIFQDNLWNPGNRQAL